VSTKAHDARYAFGLFDIIRDLLLMRVDPYQVLALPVDLSLRMCLCVRM
jgi:hypothetical protein